MRTHAKNTALGIGAAILSFSGAAFALQGTAFPVQGGGGLNVGWSVNANGGLVFNGDNQVSPTVTVANTRDAAGPRAPVFQVIGRAEPRQLDQAPALAVVNSIENHASISLTRGHSSPETNAWTLMYTNRDGLVLRKGFKSGNWTTHKFFQFDESTGTFTEFCPTDRSPDLGDRNRYVTSFTPRRQIATSSCPNEVD